MAKYEEMYPISRPEELKAMERARPARERVLAHIEKALMRVAAARYMILENPYLALELLGAANTSLANVHESIEERWRTRVSDLQSRGGVTYTRLRSIIVERLIHEEAVPDRATLEGVMRDLDALHKLILTLYKDYVAG
jgi:hypothetical protein